MKRRRLLPGAPEDGDSQTGAFQAPILRTYALIDSFRRAQASALGALGLEPDECRHRLLAQGPHWRLRVYEGPGHDASLLIVPAPIKRAYIWDLAPEVSVVRYCLSHRLRVYLLEWLSASEPARDAGLDAYAEGAIGAAVERVTDHARGDRPFVIGHSLGGTLAVICAALNPGAIKGLIALGSPLCFQEGTSSFRDAVVRLAPPGLSQMAVVPGSLLSHLSALASPGTFVWSRLADAAISAVSSRALDIQARVERWTLDEIALPARLVHEILQWLYREDRLCQGTLVVGGKTVGPKELRLPMLLVFNRADDVAPPTAVQPFLAAMGRGDRRLLEYPGEAGVGLQHLALLVGRQAHARVWPEIMRWIDARR